MGEHTKIDWCDSTWNPVTGCLHGCEYCYARRIAERFGIKPFGHVEHCVLDEPIIIADKKEPYPVGFSPTFHRYRLDEPARWTKPRTIFVCSMADLFGDWVPDEWIKAVFDACEKAPQHRYIFLTKNPGRYCDLERKEILRHDDNFWYGATYDHSNWNDKYRIEGRPVTHYRVDAWGNKKPIHDAGDYYFPGWFWSDDAERGLFKGKPANSFVCFEPLLYDIGADIGSTGGDWIIIGAETGNRKDKVKTERRWVEHICEYATRTGKPVFMKESLHDLMGDDFRQEFPWEVK